MAEKNLKKCSTFLFIREMQIKIHPIFYLTLVRIAMIRNQLTSGVGEGAYGKRKQSSIAGGITSWFNNSGNQSGGSSEN